MARNIDAVTFSPYTNKFYQGSIVNEKETGDGFDFKHDNGLTVIAKLNPQAFAKGDRSAAIIPVAHEIYRKAEREYVNRTAAVDATSLANITRVELLTEVINRMHREFHLIKGVTPVPVPKLKLDLPVQGKYTASKKVPKRQPATVKSSTFTQASFNLWKNVVDLDSPDEDEYSALISPMAFDLQQAADVLSQAENEQIYADGLVNFGASSLGSWAAHTTGVSTRNALTDVASALETLIKTPNFARPKYIAMNAVTYSAYASNSWVQGSAFVQDREIQGLVPLPKVPGIQALIDAEIPAGIAVMYDPRAMLFGQGPVVSETYRDERAGVSGNVIRKFVEPLVPTDLRSKFGVKFTGLT
jgi:hypothetical protein